MGLPTAVAHYWSLWRQRASLMPVNNKANPGNSAMSMARLWRDQGKREDARELLAPVYGWFTEGSTRSI